MTDDTSETAIREIIEARANAVRKGDVEAMSANVADHIVIFDVVSPLRWLGKAASRARAAEWVASYDGAIGWESRDVEVFADGDVGFSHSLSHVTGKQRSGVEVNMWFRTTLGLHRSDGHWLIVHEHSSAPFDPKSGEAALGLKPQ
jgi:uncharacterized protein (TIGR02246 family)